MSDFDGWLNSEQADAYIGCHVETMRQKLRAGEIESRKLGNHYRTTAQWCDTYMLGLVA